MGKINIEGYVCERCSHKWVARKKEVRVCPKCKSAWWDVPRKPQNLGSKKNRGGK